MFLLFLSDYLVECGVHDNLENKFLKYAFSKTSLKSSRRTCYKPLPVSIIIFLLLHPKR